MKRLIVLGICTIMGASLMSQSVRLDSTIEIYRNDLIKEYWDYISDEDFEYIKIDYTDSIETERVIERYVDGLNIRQETLLGGVDTLETIDQIFDVEGRTTLHKRKYFKIGRVYTFETENAYEYQSGEELKSVTKTVRSEDGTLLQASNLQYSYDGNRKVIQVIGQASQSQGGQIWSDTLLYYYLNDSITRIDVNSGYLGNTSFNESQRIYLTNFRLNIGGDTNYVYSNETRLASDSSVIEDHTEVRYVWGEGEPYMNHGTINTRGKNTFAYGSYEEFLAPRGDTLHSAFYSFISFDEGIEKLKTYFDNSALDGYRKYFFNDKGDIDYEEEYLESPWGEQIVKSKKYYYSGTVSLAEERVDVNPKFAIINELEDSKTYYTVDGKQTKQVSQVQILIEIDQINHHSRKVIYVPR